MAADQLTSNTCIRFVVFLSKFHMPPTFSPAQTTALANCISLMSVNQSVCPQSPSRQRGALGTSRDHVTWHGPICSRALILPHKIKAHTVMGLADAAPWLGLRKSITSECQGAMSVGMGGGRSASQQVQGWVTRGGGGVALKNDEVSSEFIWSKRVMEKNSGPALSQKKNLPRKSPEVLELPPCRYCVSNPSQGDMGSLRNGETRQACAVSPRVRLQPLGEGNELLKAWGEATDPALGCPSTPLHEANQQHKPNPQINQSFKPTSDIVYTSKILPFSAVIHRS